MTDTYKRYELLSDDYLPLLCKLCRLRVNKKSLFYILQVHGFTIPHYMFRAYIYAFSKDICNFWDEFIAYLLREEYIVIWTEALDDSTYLFITGKFRGLFQ